MNTAHLRTLDLNLLRVFVALLDRISTQILALDGKGNAEYFADYAQWEANRREKPLTPASGERRAAGLTPT